MAISSRNNRERGKANKYCRCISFQHRDDLEVQPGPIRFGDCPRNPWIYIARAHSTKRRHGHVDAVMQQERPPPYWRGTEQTVVGVRSEVGREGRRVSVRV